MHLGATATSTLPSQNSDCLQNSKPCFDDLEDQKSRISISAQRGRHHGRAQCDARFLLRRRPVCRTPGRGAWPTRANGEEGGGDHRRRRWNRRARARSPCTEEPKNCARVLPVHRAARGRLRARRHLHRHMKPAVARAAVERGAADHQRRHRSAGDPAMREVVRATGAGRSPCTCRGRRGRCSAPRYDDVVGGSPGIFSTNFGACLAPASTPCASPSIPELALAKRRRAQSRAAAGIWNLAGGRAPAGARRVAQSRFIGKVLGRTMACRHRFWPTVALTSLGAGSGGKHACASTTCKANVEALRMTEAILARMMPRCRLVHRVYRRELAVRLEIAHSRRRHLLRLSLFSRHARREGAHGAARAFPDAHARRRSSFELPVI